MFLNNSEPFIDCYMGYFYKRYTTIFPEKILKVSSRKQFFIFVLELLGIVLKESSRTFLVLELFFNKPYDLR